MATWQNTDRIPFIIHQIWMNPREDTSHHPIPQAYQNNQLMWKELCGPSNYKLWDESNMIEFIKRKDPEFLYTYETLPSWINRCDVFRYFIMYHMGGIYVDMDAKPTTNCATFLSELCQTKNELFAVKCEILGKSWYTNCIMASVPQQEFFRHAYQDVNITNTNVMTCAGPIYLSSKIKESGSLRTFNTMHLKDIPIHHTSDKTWAMTQTFTICKSRWFPMFMFVVLISLVAIVSVLAIQYI